jgi:alanine racemase
VTDTPEQFRAAWAEVDLEAIGDNVRLLAERAQPAALCAVVKADGYGHGAAPIARAALAAGATWLGVALVEEGVTLRDAGIAAPVLVLSEPAPHAAATVVARRLTPVVYTMGGIEALAKAVAEGGTSERLAVHLKVDTGMHRVGCAPDDALGLVDAIDGHPELWMQGLCTHLAVADEPEHPYTTEQLARFDELLGVLDRRGTRPPVVHAANSASLFGHAGARYDLVRCGIALYGVPPSPALTGGSSLYPALRPALSLRARVAHVKQLAAGARLSYGLRYELARDARVATVPVGYADGVPRNLGLMGGEVLIRGRRFPIAGTVTMDQLMVDVGDAPIEVGDEVVLLGHDHGDDEGDEITAGEWAQRVGTIAYEILTGIGPRLPRRYVGG